MRVATVACGHSRFDDEVWSFLAELSELDGGDDLGGRVIQDSGLDHLRWWGALAAVGCRLQHRGDATVIDYPGTAPGLIAAVEDFFGLDPRSVACRLRSARSFADSGDEDEQETVEALTRYQQAQESRRSRLRSRVERS